ncbi:hypothetical protein MAPG_07485 [Magnaporthiopsis poae ATCC 64411]|uniref:Heterokaryon incompatibility domain-containing protein n=1 Tax=Magnaporthiopsis poae (strain ATCC 64411 / 73-15) TaxID=644358 RepID=A0A0C4E4T4_MAGP6|nr:hypothetical protein MAPG_07485 [Magnaporthiopsis poae ATCC 64411]
MGSRDQASAADAIADPAADESYSYSPLPGDRHAIRLVQIVRDATRTRGFSISLQTVVLDDGPPFCALSYTWNSPLMLGLDDNEGHEDDEPPAMSQICCNGKNLSVNTTALEFLDRAFADGLFLADDGGEGMLAPPPALFRFHPAQTTAVTGTVPRHVWIDAICINQDDYSERSRQVGIMAQIYQRSLMTIVWLGGEAPHPDALWLVENFIPAFLRLVRAKGLQYLLLKDPDCEDVELVRYFGADACLRWRRDRHLFLQYFARRRWFSRGWVVQEASLKALENIHDVVALSGPVMMSWESLSEFPKPLVEINWLRTIHHRLPATAAAAPPSKGNMSRVTRMIELKDDIQAASRGRPSRLLLERFCCATETERLYAMWYWAIFKMNYHMFTNKRDAVYGCLGLVSSIAQPNRNQNPLGALVDYSLPVAEVFTRVALAMLQNLPYPDVLNRAQDPGASDSEGPCLPSWVPRFDRPPATTCLFSLSHPVFDACQWRRQKTNCVRLAESNLLALRGLPISSVSSKGPELDKSPGDFECEWFLQMVDQYNGTYPGTEESAEQALVRSLHADQSSIIPGLVDRTSAFQVWWAKQISQRAVSLKEKMASGSDVPSVLEALGRLQQRINSLPLAALPGIHADGIENAQALEYAVADLDRHTRWMWQFRRFFVTADRRFGIGPRSLEPGDEIWLLEGGRTPFLLRRRHRDDGGGHYRLVGEVFVHGVMYGEVATPERLIQMKEATLE